MTAESVLKENYESYLSEKGYQKKLIDIAVSSIAKAPFVIDAMEEYSKQSIIEVINSEIDYYEAEKKSSSYEFILKLKRMKDKYLNIEK